MKQIDVIAAVLVLVVEKRAETMGAARGDSHSLICRQPRNSSTEQK